VTKQSFFAEQNAVTFATLCALYDRYNRVDYPLLYAALTETTFDPIAPVEWMAKDFHWPNAPYYADIVFDLSNAGR